MEAALAILSPPVVEGVLVEDAPSSLATHTDNPPAILSLPARIEQRELVSLWLNKRSQATVRSYASDLKTFFCSFPEFDPEKHDLNQVAIEFCRWPRGAKVAALEGYKGAMLQAGRAEATINRQLSAIRSLLNFAYRLEISDSPGRGLVESERAKAYRDTRGIGPKLVKELLALPPKLHGEGTLRTLRDSLVLRLLAENGLRRSTVVALDVKDFTLYNRTIWITEKGKGSQKRAMTVSISLVEVIQSYQKLLSDQGVSRGQDDPLVVNLNRDPAYFGKRLADNGLYKIVRGYAPKLKIPKLAPHMLRHTLVTTLLELGYSPRDVQRLTGHARIETLMIYDDNRENKAGQLTDAVSDLFAGKPIKKRKQQSELF